MFVFKTGSLLGLSPEELAQYKVEVKSAFRQFQSEDHTPEDKVAFLTQVKDALDAIDGAEAATALEAELDETLADEDEDAEVVADEAAPVDVEDAADLSADDAAEADEDGDDDEAQTDADADADVIDAVDTAALQQIVGAYEKLTAQLLESAAAAEAVAEKLPVDKVDMSGLGQDVAERVGEQSTSNITLRNGHEFSRTALQAALMAAMENQHKGVPGTTDYLGTIRDEFDPELTLKDSDPTHNFEAITASLANHINSEDALVASVCCAPNDIIRDLVSYCRADGLYTLPRVAAPYGGITYALPSHACGLILDTFEWKEECDPEADPQPDKPCVEIECGKYEDVRVNAFGWCFEYCNSQAKFNPEQLEYYLAEARCRFEHIVSKRLLDMVLTHPRVSGNTLTCVTAGGGLSGDVMEILSTKFNDMRNELCNPSLRPNVVAPVWLEDLFDIDACRRGGTSKSFSQIVSQLGGTVQFVSHWQEPEKGECALPDEVDLLVHVPGIFREVDGGEMNFGLVRDSVLNAKNKVRIMYERWNALANFGPDCGACILTIEGLCPNGAVGPRTDSCAAE